MQGGRLKVENEIISVFCFQKIQPRGAQKDRNPAARCYDVWICVCIYVYLCNTLPLRNIVVEHVLCSTLQHTATHCNTHLPQFTVVEHVHCSTLQHTAAHCSTLQHTATHCNTLQHAIALCNTLQHPATHCNTQLPRYMVVEQVLGMLVELGAEMTCRNMLLVSYHIKYIYVRFISIYV